MPRLARPKKRAEALHGDDFPPSMMIEEKAFDSMSPSLPVSSSHPVDAAVEALRSLPTFRMITCGPRSSFASLSWPFGGGQGAKMEGEKQKKRSSGASSPTSSSSSSSSPSTSNSPALLPPVPDDLLKKTSALEKTVRSSPPPPLPPLVTITSGGAAKEHEKTTEEEKPKESTSSFSLWPPRFPSSLPSLPSLPLLVSLSSPGGDPDKGRLLSVADFFDHARENSKKLWRELDGDGDGWAAEGDVARALAARGLPTAYAPRVLAAARGRARWWATRVSRKEFASWMERGEPRALRAFTSMALDRSGRVDVGGIKDVLKRSGLVRRRESERGRERKRERERFFFPIFLKTPSKKSPQAATDEAAKGVLRALRSGEDGAASYAQFRSFVALLPPTTTKAAPGASARRRNGSDDDDDFAGAGGGGGFDPATAWFDAASIVPLVSGTPALDEAAAAALGTKAIAAAAPAGAATAAASSAASAASSPPPLRQEAPTKAERARARQKQRAALLRAALAGGIASGATTLALFPLDTLKTRLQASSGRALLAANAAATPTTTLASVVREGMLDKRALYRGVVPASLGSFFSHGLRTFSYEAALMVLTAAGFGAGAGAAVAATATATATGGAGAAIAPVAAAAAAASSQLRLQALASAAGTAIGTCVRIPTEVLKQRLQVGLHANALDAARAARDAGGLPWSLFAGTGATLAREVPFYAAGMAAYEILKNVADGSAASPTRTPSRELARWEMIALGEFQPFPPSVFLGVERRKFQKKASPLIFFLSLLSLSLSLQRNTNHRGLRRGDRLALHDARGRHQDEGDDCASLGARLGRGR